MGASYDLASGLPRPPERHMEKHRLQFDLSGEQLEQLDALKDRAHAVTRAELVRDALRIYNWLLEQRDAGYELELRKGRKVKSVELLV